MCRWVFEARAQTFRDQRINPHPTLVEEFPSEVDQVYTEPSAQWEIMARTTCFDHEKDDQHHHQHV